eukprot:gene17679-19443_t
MSTNNEEPSKKPLGIESATNHAPEVPEKVKYKVVQEDGSTIVYLPIQSFPSQSMRNIQRQIISDIEEHSAESYEILKQAILERIKIEPTIPDQPEVWKQLAPVTDFTKGGIIQKNARRIDAEILEKLTRKDTYECQVPRVQKPVKSFRYEVINPVAKQTVTDPFKLGSIPDFDTLIHLLRVMQAHERMSKHPCYMKTSLGLFDIKGIETMINFHHTAAIQRTVEEELSWFSSPYEKPCSMIKYPPTQNVRKFQDILYNSSIGSVLPDCEMMVEDLAYICCGRSLLVKHIEWVLTKLNSMQTETYCILVDNNHDNDDDEERRKLTVKSSIADRRTKPKSLVFIFTVNDASIVSETKGCHYVLCYVHRDEKKIVYADSQGLTPHNTFLNAVREYYTLIFEQDIIGFSLSYCHDYRLNEREVHVCERGLSCALFYPLHENMFLSGLVVAIVAAIACLAKEFFQVLTVNNKDDSVASDIYLRDAEKYSTYLRHVVICWLVEKAINVNYLVPVSFSNGDAAEREAEVSLDAIMLDHGEYTDSIASVSVNDNVIEELRMEVSVEELEHASQSEAVDDSKSDNQNRSETKDESGVGTSMKTNQQVGDFNDLDVNMESSESQSLSMDQSTDTIIESSESVAQSSASQSAISEKTSEKSFIVSHSQIHDFQEAADEVVAKKPKSKRGEHKRPTRQCPYCDYTSRRSYNVKRHVDRSHKDQKVKDALKSCETGKCICMECGHRCQRVKDMRQHLANKHQMIFHGEVLEFHDEKDFNEWKSRIEENDLCFFLKAGNKSVREGEIVYYLYCNHSGFYRPRLTDGSRPTRKFDSIKIDNNCTAALRVIKKADAPITVEACYTHYGHSRDFRGVWLSMDKRRLIETKKQNGTRGEVFKELRDSLIVRGKHCTESRPMRTVFGVDDVMKHNDDHLSLLNWIVEWDDSGVNPVIYYKLKNIEHAMEEMAADDFIIVLQSELQKKMAVQFSHYGLCCVSVQCSSYVLTSLVVIDDFNDGHPVACCISNCTDDATMRIFFTQVQQNVGELKPAWFACDYSINDFYEVFTEITNSNPRRLLYLSGVEEYFIDELSSIQNIVKEVGIYEMLFTAIQDITEMAFEDVINLLLQRKAKNPEQVFCSLQRWLRRKHEWAFCYRPTDVDSPAEEFKSWIVQRFSESMVNKRVDTAVFNLLSYVRSKWLNRLENISKCEGRRCWRENERRHSTAEEMPLNSVKPLEDRDDKYEVMDENKTFTIRIKSDKACKCLLKCTECNICPHVYNCSCPESVLNAKLCTHTHLLSRYLSRKFGRRQAKRTGASNEAFISEQDSDASSNSADQELTTCVYGSSGVKPLKEKVLALLKVLTCDVKYCDDHEQLKKYKESIQKILNSKEEQVVSICALVFCVHEDLASSEIIDVDTLRYFALGRRNLIKHICPSFFVNCRGGWMFAKKGERPQTTNIQQEHSYNKYLGIYTFHSGELVKFGSLHEEALRPLQDNMAELGLTEQLLCY